MDNGLSLTLEEFESLPKQKQLSCLYQNQVQTMKLIRGYKIYYKIVAIIGSVLTLGVGILFNMHIGQ